MNKENDGINPISLEGYEVNTVKRASEDVAKEEKDNYYVDPLEQDAIMQEKMKRIEAERERRRLEIAQENEDEEEEKPYFVNETIRPDMNVTGYFSTGNTATKKNPLKKPASSKQVTICMGLSIVNVIYALVYALTLIIKNFDSKLWFMTWVFIFLSIASIVIILNAVRILKINKDAYKNKLTITITLASVSLLPAIVWLIHWIIQTT
ncbi:hypothetical protein J6X90_03705 [Candidatus Saccharibacteria bacterium]|nr:hypothetical protein [Candidatus Saccharibacteria bacterium]